MRDIDNLDELSGTRMRNVPLMAEPLSMIRWGKRQGRMKGLQERKQKEKQRATLAREGKREATDMPQESLARDASR